VSGVSIVKHQRVNREKRFTVPGGLRAFGIIYDFLRPQAQILSSMTETTAVALSQPQNSFMRRFYYGGSQMALESSQLRLSVGSCLGRIGTDVAGGTVEVQGARQAVNCPFYAARHARQFPRLAY
jgi:hypothetical protein